MKKGNIVLLILIATIAFGVLFFFYKNNNPSHPNDNDVQNSTSEKSTTSIANPASQFCIEKGGKVVIVSNSDGSQFGMCELNNYSCEEWTFYKGECTIKDDEEKIKEKLIQKGLNLRDMKIVIKKHLGKYIEGSVVPISTLGGGGYVFAVKTNDGIEVLADGNGTISCESFVNYPDFPSYLVSECINESGNLITR